jgi:hypothetical protein
MGDFCKSLITNPQFQFLSALFEQTQVGEMLTTKSEDSSVREQIYARITGHREFLSTIGRIVEAHEQLVNPAPKDHSDDPSVHNIYEG